VRGDARSSAATALTFVTTGVLLRQLEANSGGAGGDYLGR